MAELLDHGGGPGVAANVWGSQPMGVSASEAGTAMGGGVSVLSGIDMSGAGEAGAAMGGGLVVSGTDQMVDGGVHPKRQKRKNKHPPTGVRAMHDIHRQRSKDFAQEEQAFRALGADPEKTWENLDKACEFLQSLPGFSANRLILGGRNPSTGSSGSKQYILCSMHKAPAVVADGRRQPQAGFNKCPWFIMFELSVENQWVLYSLCKDITHHNHPPTQAGGVEAVPLAIVRTATPQSLIKGQGGDIKVALSTVAEVCSQRGIQDATLHQILVDTVERHGYTADFSKDDVSNAYKIGGAPPPGGMGA